MLLKDLVKKILRNDKDADLLLVEKAYKFAEEAYQGKKRYSGKTVLTHSLEAANILAELNLDEKSIAACLLHHCLSEGVKKEKLKTEFREEILGLLLGLEKIKKLKLVGGKEESRPEDVRKVLLAATNDIRVLLIKLAVKLHNMRTLEYLPDEETKKEISQEVLSLYAPLSYRLGIGSMKSELEDLAFSYTNPEAYEQIQKKIAESKKEREHRVYTAQKKIQEALKQNKIEADVYGRAKHIYSIQRKIVDREYDIDDIKDFTALRVITENVDQCYRVLRIVHSLWKPIQGTFKDYIAMPKPNGYQSLHTVVLGPDKKAVEIQIRTREMHEIAEEGVAVHYGYKGVVHGQEFDKKLSWLKQFIDQRKSASEKNFKIDLFSERIYVFTPKGRLVELPRFSTPLDFAYNIHSDIGDHAIGANINGKYKPLKTELENGDVVEVIESKNQKPSMDWLKLVRTAKARNKIRSSLRSRGKTVVAGSGTVMKEEKKKELEESLIEVYGVEDAQIKLSLCCKPLPGNKILGIKVGETRISIHRDNCEALKKQKNKPRKEVKAIWVEHSNSEVEILIEAKDRVGLLAEILNSVASMGFNVSNTKGKALHQDKAQCSFTVKITSTEDLTRLIERVKKIQSVMHVYIGSIKSIS